MSWSLYTKKVVEPGSIVRLLSYPCYRDCKVLDKLPLEELLYVAHQESTGDTWWEITTCALSVA